MPYPTDIPPLLLRLNDWVGQGLLHRSRVKAVREGFSSLLNTVTELSFSRLSLLSSGLPPLPRL